ncbi:MAG: DUF4274 domain-containing protein [Myxococcota bacterium]
MADNRLTELALQAPALLQLDVSRNPACGSSLAGCPHLRALTASCNPLVALDPAPAPEPVALDATETRLQRLDIRGNAALARLRTATPQRPGPQVQATDVQQRRLAQLRRTLGLGTGATAIDDLDPFELHDLAQSIGGRDADQRLLAIVSAPRCDRGTALMVYWTSSPHYYARYASRDEVPSYELAGWDLLAAVEARMAGEGFATAQIPFDPADDRQTRSVRGIDWTRAASGVHRPDPRRELPRRLREPVRPSAPAPG